MSNKEVRKFVKAIEKAGAEVKKAKTNHYKIYVAGRFFMSMSCTPRDTNAIKTAQRQLAGMGLVVDYGQAGCRPAHRTSP